MSRRFWKSLPSLWAMHAWSLWKDLWWSLRVSYIWILCHLLILLFCWEAVRLVKHKNTMNSWPFIGIRTSLATLAPNHLKGEVLKRIQERGKELTLIVFALGTHDVLDSFHTFWKLRIGTTLPCEGILNSLNPVRTYLFLWRRKCHIHYFPSSLAGRAQLYVLYSARLWFGG